jgi:3-oxoacyl-[acyl-carrier-protein] synthase-1
MSQRVFITGYGIITSLGKNAAENLQSLIDRKAGYGALNVLDTVHRATLRACEVKITDQQLLESQGNRYWFYTHNLAGAHRTTGSHAHGRTHT